MGHPLHTTTPRVRTGLLLGLLPALLLGCEASREPRAGGPEAPLERVARSAGGMVVSGSEPATRVGAGVLAAGGNAVDAAVATAFALAVTEPTQSGLGGRTQALVWLTERGAFGVDATTEVPAAYDPETAEQVDDGYGTVAIPGTVAGLLELHERAGSWPLAEVMAPAIALAEDGFPLSEGEADRLAGIRDRLLLSPPASAIFLAPDSSSFRAGDTLHQHLLAEVLRAVATEGREVFYSGWIAERMAADIGAHGGYVEAEDLAAYQAEASIVVGGRYGELDLVGTYLPASGATSIEALQILDRIGLGEVDPDRRAALVGGALLMAFADRERAWNDGRPPAEDARWITSADLASERAEELLTSVAAPASTGESTQPESPHTTHLSVLDGNGMAVAMTQSLGPTGGSRVVTDGLGFFYAATVGGYLGYVEPGDRPWSSQSPMIALREGRPVLVMGGAGARRIVSSLVRTMVRVETEGMSIEEALGAPRLHPSESTWRFEGTDGAADPPGAALAAEAGYDVEILPSGDVYFARLNVIAFDPVTGVATGVADPRWVWGAASGPSAVR